VLPATAFPTQANCLLIERGLVIVSELAASLGGLTRGGEVPTVEVCTSLGDHRACPALATLLADETDSFSERAAETLGLSAAPRVYRT